jgi:phage recombination protein Bet
MTDKALARVEPEPVAITPDLIKRYICPNATDQELFLAASIAKSYGLNPFKREIHIIKYGSAPAQVVVGYEVYLKRAERTGNLNGWKVSVSEDKQTADITIHRKDWDKPFEWTVYRSEFDKGQANWKSMPAFMLKKVAMAQGFRLCFPDEMGGLPYLPEEINLGTSEALPAGEALEEHKESHKPAQEAPPPPETHEPCGCRWILNPLSELGLKGLPNRRPDHPCDKHRHVLPQGTAKLVEKPADDDDEIGLRDYGEYIALKIAKVEKVDISVVVQSLTKGYNTKISDIAFKATIRKAGKEDREWSPLKKFVSNAEARWKEIEDENPL